MRALAVSAFALFACNPVQESHIAENVPTERDFSSFLQRAPRAYFGAPGVEYELLREEPTQSGAAYPKYYAWVKIGAAGKAPREGVVRLAAIDQTRFEVTNFLSAAEIKNDPSRVDQIFPASLCPVIKERAARHKLAS